MRAKSDLKEEYKQYTLGLALFDMVPVLLFLASGLILDTVVKGSRKQYELQVIEAYRLCGLVNESKQ